MLNELLKAVLVPVVAVGLKFVLAAIGVEIDEVLFNTIVAGIVAYILAALGLDVAAKCAPKYVTVKREPSGETIPRPLQIRSYLIMILTDTAARASLKGLWAAAWRADTQTWKVT